MAQSTKLPMKRPRSESVQSYSVQCIKCSKWRLIPTKVIYEEIREKFSENYFTCSRAREWRPQISCQDATDIVDGDKKYLWAMDKPNIPRTPPGWQRLIRRRTRGGTKFVDVFYVTPLPYDKILRSMPLVDKFLQDYPECTEGGRISRSQFCFTMPVPRDKSYVKKCQSRAPAASPSRQTGIVPSEVVNPNLWIVPYVAPESVSAEALTEYHVNPNLWIVPYEAQVSVSAEAPTEHHG